MTPPLLPVHNRPHTGRRILLISPYPPSRTGPAEYAAVFASQCAGRGFQVRVLAEQVNGEAPRAPGAGVEIDRVWTPDRAGMARLFQAAERDSSEVVHVNYSFTMYGGAFAGLNALVQFARLARHRPLVVTLFDVLPRRELTRETLSLYHVQAPPHFASLAVGAILRFLARVADRIVVQSSSTQQTLERDYGVPSGKIVVTELPGYPPAIGPSSREPAVAPAPGTTIVYYGFLAPYKGVESLLAAYARARATLPARGMRLVVAGANHPRLTFDYAAELRKEASRLGIGPAEVEFPGYLDEAASQRLFASSSLVVLPYLRTTGSSGTLASAIGLDRPVVVSDLPPLVGQLDGYPHGKVVPPGDVAALAEVIRTVAEGRFVPRKPPTAHTGRVRRWEDLVDRTAAVYSSAIEARRRDFTGFAPELGADTETSA